MPISSASKTRSSWSALRRLSTLSRQEFADYWRGVHGPLIVALSSDLGIVKYVQCHAVDSDGETSLDGVAEVRFESREDQGRRNTDPVFHTVMEHVRADEANFIVRDLTIVCWGHDTLLMPAVRVRAKTRPLTPVHGKRAMTRRSSASAA
jgi:uncharacterized protein (TIGR02118 family)